MQLIRQNPFHILGFLAGTNQRTIEKQKGKINAYQKVGKDIEFSEDLNAICIPDRTNGAIEKALSQIEINQNKVFHSLFWFVNTNHLDETALGYLRTGDIDKSLDIWEKVTNGKSVNDKNFGAFNNLGTLKFFYATHNNSLDSESLLEAVRLKTDLIKSESFVQFCHTVADETYTTDAEKELLRIISSILDDIKSNGVQSPKNLLGLISQIDPSIKNLLSEKISNGPFLNIETIIDQTKKKRTQNPESGFTLARKLYKATKEDFGILADIIEKSDAKYKMIADKLAKEILQCGIDYFQIFREDENGHRGDLGNDIMRIFKYANSIAEGLQTKERIEQNIEGLQEWIDSSDDREKQRRIKDDLEFITAALDSLQNKNESISDASELVNSTKSGLSRIREALGSNDELYLGISSAVVHNAQGMLVAIVNKEQERFGPVQIPGHFEFLLTTVKQAISVMQSLASFDMVSDLRHQFNTNKDSLNSILGQLNSIQSRAQRQTSSSSGGCYIATMAYGSYEHTQVIELRKFRDSVLIEYALGRRFINFYYKHSPRLVEILKDKLYINSVIKSMLNLLIRIIK